MTSAASETATTSESPAAAVAAAPRSRSDAGAFPVSGWRVALETAFAAAAALVVVGILYRVWDLRWAVPIYEDRSDARGVSAQMKTIAESGWWVHNPKLNFPYGQFHADFPAGGETLQHFAVKLLMWVTPGYGQTLNLYYLAGFGVVAAVAFLVLRHLRFAFPIALVAALAYAFLPFHFAHEQDHLHRSAYYGAPLACLLLLWALSWRTSFLADPDPPDGVRWWRNLRRGRVLFAAALCVVVGTSETMTTAFTMALLGASAIVAAVRWREPQRLLVAGALIAMLLVSFLVVSTPTIVRIASEGKNPVVAVRAIGEAEKWALKLGSVVIPPQDHRWRAAARLGKRAQFASPLPTEGGQYLGLVGAAGLVGGLIGLLGRGLRRAGPRDLRPPTDREALTDHASLLLALCVLLGTVAGFSTVLAVAGFSQVRSWGRIEVILALFALIIVAVWFERLGPWLDRRMRNPLPVVVLLTVLVGGFALWDQTKPTNRDYAAMTASWVSDERFVTQIDQRMPDGAAIFQLPIMQFPEGHPPGRMQDYDPYRGYLHDDGSLRWSYGGVKGRPIADWQVTVRDDLTPVRALPALLGLGYDGLWVDQLGYADGGVRIRAELEKALRTPPLPSENGRFLFFDLRPYAARLGRSEEELDAITERRLGFDPDSGPPDPR